jgi:HAD superfamily hydrolase (TIGR01549 family)
VAVAVAVAVAGFARVAEPDGFPAATAAGPIACSVGGLIARRATVIPATATRTKNIQPWAAFITILSLDIRVSRGRFGSLDRCYPVTNLQLWANGSTRDLRAPVIPVIPAASRSIKAGGSQLGFGRALRKCDVETMQPLEERTPELHADNSGNDESRGGNGGHPGRRFKAAIFDLDNCLSAADEPGAALFEPAFEAIRRVNQGRLNDQELEAAFSDCWRHALDFVAKKHGFNDEMLAAAWEALRVVEVQTRMQGYGDLRVLKELDLMRFLVTSGFRRLQESKIRALGVKDWFAGVYIDAIDEPDRKGKKQIFAEILDRHGLRPEDVLVVGDNADSEIEAGNQLGIETLQILRPGVPLAENATWQAHDLRGVERLVNR